MWAIDYAIIFDMQGRKKKNKRITALLQIEFHLNFKHISGMWGYKGGSKENRIYPTVQNVREQFYKLYSSAFRGAKVEDLQIPLVGRTVFRS